MSILLIALIVVALALVALVAGAFAALATGRLGLDLGWGRSTHELGPIRVEVDAPRELLFEVLAAPYRRRVRDDSIEVLAGDGQVVVASHMTKVQFYEARTIEVIELEEPERMGFRHLMGPVPHAVEEFSLESLDDGRAALTYTGELGIDFFFLGRLAGRRWVVPQWNDKVREHLEGARDRAEQRAAAARRREQGSQLD